MSLYPEALLAALIYLQRNGPATSDGICAHIDSYLAEHSSRLVQVEASRLRHNLMETWPDSCGDSAFPVEGYAEYHSCHDKWQNPRRWQLLNWMITQLEAQQSC